MTEKDPSGYPVGYKKPPTSTRFAPGQSGNRKGRLKGSRNFSAVLQAELNSKVLVTENGRQKKLSKREVIAKRMVNSAAEGDTKAIPILLNEDRQRMQQATTRHAEDVLQQPEDELVIASIQERWLRAQASTQEPSIVTDPQEDGHDSDPR